LADARTARFALRNDGIAAAAYFTAMPSTRAPLCCSTDIHDGCPICKAVGRGQPIGCPRGGGGCVRAPGLNGIGFAKGDTLCPPEAVAGWLDLTLACNGRAGPLWMPAFAGMTKEFRCQFTQPSIFAPSMAPRVRSWQKSTSDFCRRALRALRTSAPSLPANALSVRLLIAHCRTGRRFLQAAGRDQLGPVSGSSRRKRSGGRLAPAQGGNGACDCHR